MTKYFNSIEEFGIWVGAIGIKVFSYYESQRSRDVELQSNKPFEFHLVPWDVEEKDGRCIINADVAIKDLIARYKKLSMTTKVEVYVSKAFPNYSIKIEFDHTDHKYWEVINLTDCTQEILEFYDEAKLMMSVLKGDFYVDGKS